MLSIIVGCSSKEARESKYWIDLLIATDYLDINEIYVKSLINEIVKLLTSIVKSSRISK